MSVISYQVFEPFLCVQCFVFCSSVSSIHTCASHSFMDSSMQWPAIFFFKFSVCDCDKLWGHDLISKDPEVCRLTYHDLLSFQSLFFWWPLHLILLPMPLDVNSASWKNKNIPLSSCGHGVCQPCMDRQGFQYVSELLVGTADYGDWWWLLSIQRSDWCWLPCGPVKQPRWTILVLQFQSFTASKSTVLPMATSHLWVEYVRVM